MDRVGLFLNRTLTTRVSPMVYIMMFVSIVIGFCFATGALVQGGESVLFANGALIPINIWGTLLFVFASLAEVGLVLRRWNFVSVGSLICFSLWLLASIDLVTGRHWYALLVLGLFHMLFQSYVYLAASVGVLERASVTK